MVSLLTLLACQKDVADTGFEDLACTACSLTDPQNYHLEAAIYAQTWRLAAETDVVVDWSTLTTDMTGAAMAPEEVDRVLLVAFLELNPGQIAEGLATDTLTQSDAAIFMICRPDGSNRCALSDFSILGSTLDIEEVFSVGQGTWLVALTTTGMLGSRSMTFLQAAPHTEDSLAIIDDGAPSSRCRSTCRRCGAWWSRPVWFPPWSGPA